MRILILILMFFIIGALIIISNNNLAMHETENFSNFSETYTGWLNQVYVNVQSITGDVVKLEWFPK